MENHYTHNKIRPRYVENKKKLLRPCSQNQSKYITTGFRVGAIGHAVVSLTIAPKRNAIIYLKDIAGCT